VRGEREGGGSNKISESLPAWPPVCVFARSMPFLIWRTQSRQLNTQTKKNSLRRWMLQHAKTHCDTLQQTAAHSSTLQHTAAHCNTLQHTAAHYSTLQHTATHCSTLQHTATHGSTLQHTATHCSTLQHTIQLQSQLCDMTIMMTNVTAATHCNTLQHTATHHSTAITAV